MKSLVLIALLFGLVSYSCFAQVAIEWQKAYGGGSLESLGDIKTTSDGGYIIAASSGSVDGDVTGYHLGQKGDAWVLKISATGAVQWQGCFGGKKEDNGVSIAQTSDGGYILFANTTSVDGDVDCQHGVSQDGWVLKLGATGNIVWKKCLGGTLGDMPFLEGIGSISQTSDGGYILGGSTYSTDGDVTNFKGGSDAWIVKLNASGSIGWAKTYGGSTGDVANSILQVSTGGYVFVGNTTSTTHDVTGLKGAVDMWLVRLDDTGKIKWQKCIGGSGSDDGRSIIETSDGGFAFIGQTYSKDGDVKSDKSGIGKMWLIKTDTSGDILWERTFGGPGYERPSSLVERANGDIVMVGTTTGDTLGDIPPSKGLYDIVLASYDKNGTFLWKKTMGGLFYDLGYRIINTPDGGLMVCGSTESTDGDAWNNGLHASQGTLADIWLIKLKDDTANNVVNIVSEKQITVYPTVTAGTVYLSIPFEYRQASATVLNIMGQRLDCSTEFREKEGRVILENIPAGTYLLKLVCDGIVTTMRIVYQP